MDPESVSAESPVVPAPPRPRRRLPKWLLPSLGYTISVISLIWVLHDYPIGDLMREIRALSWRWVALGVLADLTTYVAHAWRWITLLGPVARLGLWRTTQSIYIGLFANEVLPLRTGEVIRCYLLGHWNDVRLSLVFASATVERLLDGFWMVVAFIVTATYVKAIPKNLVLLVQATGVLILLGGIVLIWIARRRHEVHTVIGESKWSATLRHVVEGLHLMGKPRTLIATGLISLLYLALQIVTFYALMRAYGLDLSFWAAGGVLTIVRFGVVIPNAPGNLGLFQVACVIALTLFDVGENDAKTFSFVMFFAITLPLLIGGAIATALTGLNLGELRERARRRAAEHVG